MLCPVHSLGPGERLCLWTQGCSKNCPGCISREMQPHEGEDIPEDALSSLVIRAASMAACTALTVSGGDPFEQSGPLLRFLRAVRGTFPDILVYTGWTLSEIRGGAAGEDGIRCLDLIDVLIDGRYTEALNEPDCVLRGSSNQVVHFLNPAPEAAYREYMKRGRILETFTHNHTAIVTGIMDRRNAP